VSGRYLVSGGSFDLGNQNTSITGANTFTSANEADQSIGKCGTICGMINTIDH